MKTEPRIVDFEMDDETYQQLEQVSHEVNRPTQSIVLVAVIRELKRLSRHGKVLSLIESKGVRGISDYELKRTKFGKGLFDKNGRCKTLNDLEKSEKIRLHKFDPASNGKSRYAWVICE